MSEESRSLPPADVGEMLRCVAEIRSARQERRAPAFSGHTLGLWTRALNRLLTEGKLASAEHGVRHLHAAYPRLAYGRNMCRFFDRMPPADGALLPFRDRKSDVQPVLREGADTVLLAFCGGAHRLGMPLYSIHRWLGRLPASLIYLRDFKRLFFLDGVQSLGNDRATTLAALLAMVASMRARRIVCFGTSAGGFAALDYGLALGAEAVLSFGAPTNLSIDFNRDLRTLKPAQSVHRKLPGCADDLRKSYAAAARPPRALLMHSRNNWDDRLHAENMAGLPSITLHGTGEGDEHNVIMTLIRAGGFEATLDWLLNSSAMYSTGADT